MAVITISRQAGSRGARIARGLAKELGWEFADKSTVNRVIRQYGLVRLNELYHELPTLGDLFSDNAALTIEMMNETIAAIAARGNVVILGRGAFAVLKGVPDVLNVFVEAPEEARAARIAQRDGIDLETAVERVRADDKLRRKFTRRYYGTNWAKHENYDLVVDSGEISDAQAIEQILAALHALPSRAEEPTAEARPVHPVLAQTIDEVMGAKA
ncbi:MAG: cytidylate kinase-like family protein [Propionicimonas sp.]